MLRAEPNNWFSWKFAVLDENNRAIARIDIGWLREAGELYLDGRKYSIYRERPLGGAFILEEDGKEVARAEKPSALLRSFTVRYDGKMYTLEAVSPVARMFVLCENGRTLGTIKPEHALTRKALIDLPAQMPLPTRIFMAWLVFVLWKRDADASP